jgi:methylenetetrahydrofolate reductase (NADPH)
MHSLNIASQAATASSGGLYALEVTAKDITQVEASKTEIPLATPINIAFLGNEDHAQRVNAARVIRTCGSNLSRSSPRGGCVPNRTVTVCSAR